jgi:hypothetical protein
VLTRNHEIKHVLPGNVLVRHLRRNMLAARDWWGETVSQKAVGGLSTGT